ncbi:hypothetical protein [Rummeliibacillus stabekisii]|uniref:hypothetical protein n=1 Tax=Rummeliibacillus stabekisii TaxID=241244 RepID=UPI00371B90D9
MIRYYYDLTDGSIFFETNCNSDRTLEQDLEVFKPLQERVKGTYSYIDKEYEDIKFDLENSVGVSVDLDTGNLIFEHKGENGDTIIQDPITEKITRLEAKTELQEQALAELTMYISTLGI